MNPPKNSHQSILTDKVLSDLSIPRLLDSDSKPEWFSYPESFLRLCEVGFPEEGQWELLTGEHLLKQITRITEWQPGRYLIPIAENNTTDDLACFERGCGDSIVIIHRYGLEKPSGKPDYASLDKWMKEVYELATNQLLEYLEEIRESDTYRRNIKWGEVRSGHSEGTIENHIKILEDNLQKIASELTPYMIAKLRLLIHVHDTFKPNALPNVPISDPQSHAQLAAGFLREYTSAEDLIAMTSMHDELFAIWRKSQQKGTTDQSRFVSLLKAIKDWDSFLIFNIIDGSTADKDLTPIKWAISSVTEHKPHLTRDYMRLFRMING